MTIFRSAALITACFTAITIVPAASAQISTGTEYRQAVDEARDSFGEDYDSQKRAAEESRATGREISASSKSYIASASKALQAGDHAKAIAQSNQGLTQLSLTPYEESVFYQLNAAASIGLKDYAGAKTSYDSALATGGMNDEETTKVQGTLAKLTKMTG